MDVNVTSVAVTFPDGANIIVGQSHFIKTAEDIAEIIELFGAGGEVWPGILRGFRSVPDQD